MSLAKSLDFADGVNLVIGSVVGSGIFASPGVVLRRSGSGGAALVVWAVSGLISYCGALSYAELATMMPSAGGEVTYLTRFYGKRAGFLFTWASTTVGRPSTFAITSMICGQYLCRFMFGKSNTCSRGTSHEVVHIAILVMLSVLCINSISSRLISHTLRFSTAMSVCSLTVAILVGPIYAWTAGLGNVGFENTSTDVLNLSPAFLAALWAYDGWNTLNYATEELRSTSDLLKVIRVSIPFITLLFVLVNATYLIVLDDDVVAHSQTIGVDLAKSVFGELGEQVMPLLVAISAFGSAAGNMFSGGRLVFSSARDRHLPEYFARVNEVTQLPIRALLCQSVIGVVFMWLGEFETIVGMYSCSIRVFYIATLIGLLRQRYSEPDIVRPYKVPLVAPIAFITVSSLLLIAEFFSRPTSSFTALAFILVGIPFYELQKTKTFRNVCCFAPFEDGDYTESESEEEVITYNTF